MFGARLKKKPHHGDLLRIYGLVNVYGELGMSSILWNTKQITKLTYGTLIHIDLNLESSMYRLAFCGNPCAFSFTRTTNVPFYFHVLVPDLLYTLSVLLAP